jgi:hypothetical protein
MTKPDWRCHSVVECLSSTCEASGSIPSATKIVIIKAILSYYLLGMGESQTEAGGTQVQGQPVLHNEAPFKETKQNKTST